MAWFLGQSFLMIAGAFVLGLLVGWLWWGRRQPQAQSQAAGVRAAAAPVENESPFGSATGTNHLVPRPATAPEPVVAGPEPVITEAAEPEPVIVEPAVVEPVVVEPVVVEPVVVEPEPVVAEPTVAAPVVVESAPEPEVADDLRRIEGIGPKMAAALEQAGIRSYRRLAETDEQALRTAIEAAGLRFAPSLVTWSRQARLLADGDEDGFADLTRRLVAGRDVGRS